MAGNLEECRSEMITIINKIRFIAWEIQAHLSGIGENMCYNCLDRIAEKYEGVLKRMDNVDPERTVENDIPVPIGGW